MFSSFVYNTVLLYIVMDKVGFRMKATIGLWYIVLYRDLVLVLQSNYNAVSCGFSMMTSFLIIWIHTWQ